jgi:1,4-alpha-glucan branching enzyme
LHQLDLEPAGFEWIDGGDYQRSVLTYLRKGKTKGDVLLVACNFTPVPRINYRVGAPKGGFWREVLNSDAADYGGSGTGNLGLVEAAPIRSHGRRHALNLTLPPLGVVVLKPE